MILILMRQTGKLKCISINFQLPICLCHIGTWMIYSVIHPFTIKAIIYAVSCICWQEKKDNKVTTFSDDERRHTGQSKTVAAWSLILVGRPPVRRFLFPTTAGGRNFTIYYIKIFIYIKKLKLKLKNKIEFKIPH